jgi:hypothetical protein
MPTNIPDRDPSNMVDNSNSGLYTALGVAALLVVGFIAYSNYEPTPKIPPADAPITQPK